MKILQISYSDFARVNEFRKELEKHFKRKVSYSELIDYLKLTGD